MDNNLDKLAAQCAQQIIKDTTASNSSEVDNLVTKTLGVLQDQGVYAATLFLFSRTSKADQAIAPTIRQKLFELISTLVPRTTLPPNNAQDALKFVTEHVADDIDTLFLVKQVWEQTLIYARYGAKAAGKEGG